MNHLVGAGRIFMFRTGKGEDGVYYPIVEVTPHREAVLATRKRILAATDEK